MNKLINLFIKSFEIVLFTISAEYKAGTACPLDKINLSLLISIISKYKVPMMSEQEREEEGCPELAK